MERALRHRPMVAVSVAAVGAAVVLAGSWAESGEARTSPLPDHPSAPAAHDSSSADAEGVFEGATTTVVFPKGGGTLFVAVQREVRRDGRERVALMAERGGGCELHRVHGKSYNADCGVLWRVERQIPPSSFEPNAAMGEAELDVRLKRERLRVKWQGQGVPQIKTDPAAGYVLLQTQDAKAAVRWGKTSWAWPDDFGSKHAGDGLIYRRVE